MRKKQALNQMLRKTWGGYEGGVVKGIFTKPQSEDFEVNYSRQSGSDNTQHIEDAKERQGCSCNGKNASETCTVCCPSRCTLVWLPLLLVAFP